MFKKVVCVFFVALIIGNVAFAESMFSDVPADHWARESVDLLASKGIVQTGSEKFIGSKAATRFELAQFFVKALAHLEQRCNSSEFRLSADDLRQIQRLNDEFADELALMGVRQTSIAEELQPLRLELSQLRLEIDKQKSAIKDSSEKVLLSGDWLVRHTSKIHRHDFATNPLTGRPTAGNGNNVYTESQIRIRTKTKIDENINFSSRVRFFTRGNDRVNAAQTTRGGTFGLNGIGQDSVGDMVVDSAYLEINKAFNDKDHWLLGRSSWDAGHGLILNNDFDSVRYVYAPEKYELTLQYIYDRRQGSYADNTATDFRGVWFLGLEKKLKRQTFYVNFYAQDEVNLANRRVANTFVLGKLPGEQSSDSRRDAELGGSVKVGKNDRVSMDFSLVISDYLAKINKPAVGKIVDVDMNGYAGYAAANWRANKGFSAKAAYVFADDRFAGAYSLHLDRRWSMGEETPYEDIARGNQWFTRGMLNMSSLKLQAEFSPEKSKHYFRIAADFLDEIKDHVSNDLSHHLAGNTDGVVPAGFVKDNSPYDTFNNVGIADPKMLIMNFEYRYQLAKNTRIRVGFVNCAFAGDARRKTPGVNPVKAGSGLNSDYDYQLFWAEVYSRF